jgi:hypothetical protein
MCFTVVRYKKIPENLLVCRMRHCVTRAMPLLIDFLSIEWVITMIILLTYRSVCLSELYIAYRHRFAAMEGKRKGKGLGLLWLC